MIESLSVAAEITAGLLLLSLSWDRPNNVRANQGQDPERSSSSKPARPLAIGLRFPILRWSGTLAKTDEGQSLLERDRKAVSIEMMEYFSSIAIEHRDGLTGLINRTGLEECIIQLRSPSENPPANPPQLLLALLTIDQLEEMNSTRGRLFSDFGVRHVATGLQEQLGHCSILCRLDNGKFLVAFIDWELPFAQAALEKARVSASAHPFEREGHTQPLTLSSGLLACRDSDTLDSIIPILDCGTLESGGGQNTGRWRDGEIWRASSIEPTGNHDAETCLAIEETKVLPVPESSAGQSSHQEASERASSEEIEALLASLGN